MTNKKNEKNEILSLWRNLGFLSGLKEGGITEWRCAKSFDLMAKYLLYEINEKDKTIHSWDVALFPAIRRCITKNNHRISRVIIPNELISFLKEKKINECLKYIQNLKGKQILKYKVKCFEKYLESTGELDRPLIEALILIDKKMRKKINYIFDVDYEAEVCSFISDYFCDFITKENKSRGK